MIFVYTTCANKKEAESIAQSLIKENLISGANYWECNSVYFGSERIIDANECVLICHTEDVLFGEVQDRIIEMSSYEMPLVSYIDIEMNPEYITWMERFLK